MSQSREEMIKIIRVATRALLIYEAPNGDMALVATRGAGAAFHMAAAASLTDIAQLFAENKESR